MSDERLDPRLVRAVEVLKRPRAGTPEAKARVLEAVAAERARRAREAAEAPVVSLEEQRRARRPAHRGWIVTAALAAGLGGVLVGRTLQAPATAGPVPVRPIAQGTVVEPAGGAARAVEFTLAAPGASRVTVAGDFNGWQPDALVLERGVGDVWRATLTLPPGRYRYAFLVDGTEWRADPRAAMDSSDEFGVSSVLLVGGAR